jgi:hypothetical protein
MAAVRIAEPNFRASDRGNGFLEEEPEMTAVARPGALESNGQIQIRQA